MKIFLCLALAFSSSLTCHAATTLNPAKPNIIFILADDLGYGDVGVFYQNSRAQSGKPAFSTPNLDALAASGLMLTNHYTASPVCAPARASLMTGQSQGTCTIRDNEFDKPLEPGVLTLADVLHHAGYHTSAIGKWGLGGHGGEEGFPAHPTKRGFDDFFGFMRHGFGHVYYHDARHPLMENQTGVGAKYENIYSTDLFTAKAKQFIANQHTQHPDQPFFLYLAYTAVHMVLDVPANAYPPGGGLHGGLQWPLNPTPDTRNTWIHPDYATKPWTDPMKRYATMARRLDDGVGDLMQLLKDLQIQDNTLVIFTSDNGPENMGGPDPRFFDSWGPFDGFKRDVFEGGVREPTIVSWQGHIPPGRKSDFVSTFCDWMPTLANAASLPAPAQSDGLSILPTLLQKEGQKEHPFLYSEYFFATKNYSPASRDVFARKGVTGREQQQFVRIGDYVGLRTQIKTADDPLRLYNVTTDPHQDKNLAADPAHAALLKQMTELMVSARRPNSDAKRPYDDIPIPAVTPTQELTPGTINLSVFAGAFPYTPAVSTLVPTSTARVHSIELPAKKPADSFAIQFQGFFKAPVTGQYTFTTTPAVSLWLNEAHILANETQTTIRLAAGLHPFRLICNCPPGTTFSFQCTFPTAADHGFDASALYSSP